MRDTRWVRPRPSARGFVHPESGAPLSSAADDPAPKLMDSASRLEVLRALHLVDAPTEPSLEAVARATAQATGCAVALVNLLDAEHAWHVARVGIDQVRTPRSLAFCNEAIRQPAFFEIPDLRLDARFAEHPMVSGAPGWRHYAATPLVVAGERMGTLCVLDATPGALPAAARRALQALGEVASDLLGQRRHRHALDDQVERLRDLTRAAGDWAWELDADLRLCWIDGDFAKVTGIDPNLALGQALDFEPLVDNAGHPLVPSASLQDLLSQRQPFQRVLSRLHCPRGSLLISRSAVPVFDAGGHFKGYRGAASDVTSRVERDRLLRDKAALASINRERSAFLSRVSHELRTPLNAILGFTQLLRRDHDSTDPASSTQQRLQGIEDAGHHLLELVNDVLNIVRIEQGREELDLQTLPLAEQVERAVAAQQALAASRQVQVTHVVPAALSVQADAQALSQVLEQLLSNAIKYNRPGGRVECVAQVQAPWVRLCINDTGVGLLPDELSRLFHPFARPGAERHHIDGTGLGLVLARELVLSMGGHLEAHSSLGQGSSFQIDLPLVSPEETLQRDPPPTHHERRDPVVLYIEDEPLNVLLVQEIFKARPHWQLHIAHDGAEGVALAAKLLPDMALVDMNLPDFGGLEVLQRLQANAATRQMHCVALSADAMPEQINTALAAGFQDYWTKPIDLAGLLAAIERTLKLPPAQ